ncbi:hypothetical protein STRDD11_01745 [Streptococcus sp. DD11]|uniref:ABC transporter permease n=1 Tax=Streptococcus sp. DD11 TaxID=1777879 RepID=UPI000792A657|nr:ABC transporter permease [Streptococcus sp. DD11]KXT82952.1 hypothetical protein STRDD11_01745 [Streptococcus sp. DD11]
MLHTFQADFYRFFRSKAVWITEAIFLLLTLFSAVGKANAVQTIQGVSSGHGNNTFIIIILSMIVIGTDMAQQLYKNTLTSGVSRTSFFISKGLVMACVIALQMAIFYAFSFMVAAVLNGIGPLSASFLFQFILVFCVQFLATMAWTAMTTFVLYLSKSMIAALGAHLFCASLTGALAQFYPKSQWLQHLTMSFDFELVQSSGVTMRIVLIALLTGAALTAAGLYTLHKKDL